MLTKQRLRDVVALPTEQEAKRLLDAFSDKSGELSRSAQETLFYDALRLVMVRRAVQAGFYTDELKPDD